MLKSFAIALFVIVMSAGLAHATHAHKPMMAACAEGQQASARCLCGTGAGARPSNLREGAMVPLHGTCLFEVRVSKLRPPEPRRPIAFTLGSGSFAIFAAILRAKISHGIAVPPSLT